MSKPQTPDYTEISATIEATPANVMGALKQDVSDLGAYLNNTPAIHINTLEIKKHLEHMIKLLGALRNMQMAIAAQAEKVAANVPDARKN